MFLGLNRLEGELRLGLGFIFPPLDQSWAKHRHSWPNPAKKSRIKDCLHAAMETYGVPALSRKHTDQVKYFPGFPGFSLDFPTGFLLSIYPIALHLFPTLSQYGEEVPV
jgi:hypothetical protein